MKKNKLITSVAASVLLVCLLAVGVVFAVTPQSEAVWSDVDLQSEYAYGDVLQIPARTMTVGGKTHDARFVVILPDGTTSVQSELKLTSGGTYTIRYYVNDGVYYSREETFVVFDYLYSFGNDKSHAEYSEENGLSVTLADGDTMAFNTVIDLNNISVRDALFTVIATPKKEGQFDFSRMFFTFTDVLDPSNTMTVSLRRSLSNDRLAYMYTYLMAGGNGQALTGVEGSAPPYNVHVEGTSVFGRPVSHSFSNNFITTDYLGNAIEPTPNNPVTVNYDNDTKELFTNGLLISDLDSPDYFSSLWEGFESGKVRLSVTCDLYDGAYAHFTVKSVYGIDLSSGKINDTEGPDITINNEYGGDMPAAAMGTLYSVPTATARDANSGVSEVETVVWFNYNTAQKIMVSVSNGSFRVDRVGTYAIVYTSHDRYGNVSEEILYVVAKEKIDAPEITLDSAPDTDILLGERIIPAAYTAVSNSGKAIVDAVVKFADETFVLDENGFMPEKAGAYLVEYTVTDYIGQTDVEHYTVNVAANPEPLFLDIPDFPLVLISGSEQQLPTVFVNDYSSGTLERVPVDPSATDANGTVKLTGNKLTPTVAANGDEVTLVYEYKTATLEKRIPVVSVWDVADSGRPRVNLDRYLFSDNGSISTESTEQSIIVSALTSDASFVFANKQPAEKLELIFSSISGKSRYEAIKISIIDSENQDIRFDVLIVNNGSRGADAVIDGKPAALSSSIGQGSRFNVYYSNKEISIGVSTFSVKTCTNGAPFEGFVSDKVYLEFSFVGASGGSAVALESVNGHSMTNLTSDRTAPKIVVCGEYGGSYKIGSEVTIPACIVGDVLDPNSTATITVTSPDGKIVTSLAGVSLKDASPFVKNSFKADQYGQYKVVITANDTFNSRPNEAKLTFLVNIVDDVKPTVSFGGEFVSSAKVGDVILLPDITVSDNITSAEEITVVKYVYTPSGKLLAISESSNSVKVTLEGVYEFRFYVRDAEGNLTFVRKYVTVTKE